MIQFGTPEIKPGCSYIDMHFHTKYSDGTASVQQVLKKIQELHIGVSITDHNEIKGALEAFENAKSLIIPGIEVKSKELVDILFYFYDINDLKRFFKKEILPFRKQFLHMSKTTVQLSKVFNLSKKYNCIISIAHPFGYTLRSTARNTFTKYAHILSQCDIFEAINGGNFRAKNQESIDYIRKHNKGYTAGSDGHSIYTLGNVVTYSKADTIKDFLDNIKNKKNSVAGSEVRMGKLSIYVNYAKSKLNFFRK